MVTTVAAVAIKGRTRSTTAAKPAIRSAPSMSSLPRRVRKPRSPGPAPTHVIMIGPPRYPEKNDREGRGFVSKRDARMWPGVDAPDNLPGGCDYHYVDAPVSNTGIHLHVHTD